MKKLWIALGVVAVVGGVAWYMIQRETKDIELLFDEDDMML